MNTATESLKSVTLWQSYVGKGAPSNAASARTGLGWTKREASQRAAHWNNQAPYEKFRRITLVDRSGPSMYTSDEEQVAVNALNWLTIAPTLSAAESAALAHYEASRYASAWLTLHPAPVKTA